MNLTYNFYLSELLSFLSKQKWYPARIKEIVLFHKYRVKIWTHVHFFLLENTTSSEDLKSEHVADIRHHFTLKPNMNYAYMFYSWWRTSCYTFCFSIYPILISWSCPLATVGKFDTTNLFSLWRKHFRRNYFSGWLIYVTCSTEIRRKWAELGTEKIAKKLMYIKPLTKQYKGILFFCNARC